MKFSTILLIGIAILFLINIVTAQSDLSDNEHYVIVGHVYEPYTEDNIVTLINTRTGEYLKEIAIDCDHGMKEYLFNLANLHHGWKYDDSFIISYGNETIQFNILKDSVAAQVDINRPDDIDPIFILTGSVIVLCSGGVYYYFKRKKKSEVTTLADIEQGENETGFKLLNDFGVRALIATIMSLGYIGSIVLVINTGNDEMMSTITSIYSPIIMAIITFYFMGSTIRDLKTK